ncbi:hypothetical protein [Rhodopirellula bahusiensis]|uniref:Uncharacterized protein n=1 Tax=Rhodopirellula bahusiensis TaxID=2014065 RepID=A0A2G1WEJ8_9BACT|nr:hypothetical protein [Rhodopirellula bahusiensis]PHQ37239.1 hypothetical protein CEE69_02570 [Rhodopirellula bahusiensis]
MNVIKFSFVMLLFSAVAVGCGDDSGAKSIYDEDEMAKYRQTPEELREGMLKAQEASRTKSKEMAKQAKES